MNAVRREIRNAGWAVVTLCTIGALVLGGARPARASASDDVCKPTSETLRVGSMAFDLAGTYRVQFVGTEGRARRKQVGGTLTLKALDPEARRVPVVADSATSFQRVLSGTLDADLDRVGGIVPGPDNHAEVIRTMVVVEQWDGLYESRPFTEISVDVRYVGKTWMQLRLDDASFGMIVQRMDAKGFRGTWHSSVGMTATRASGHFCAWRVSEPGL